MGTMLPRRPFSDLLPHHVHLPDGQGRTMNAHGGDLGRVMRHVRRATRVVEEVVARNPLRVVGLAAGGAFALGALFGAPAARRIAVLGMGWYLSTLTRGERARAR